MATADDVIKEIEAMKKELLEALSGKESKQELNEFIPVGELTAINTTNVQEFLALAAGAGLGDPIKEKAEEWLGGFQGILGILAGNTGKAILGAGIAMFLGKQNKTIKLFGQGMLIDAVGDFIKDFAGQFLK